MQVKAVAVTALVVLLGCSSHGRTTLSSGGASVAFGPFPPWEWFASPNDAYDAMGMGVAAYDCVDLDHLLSTLTEPTRERLRNEIQSRFGGNVTMWKDYIFPADRRDRRVSAYLEDNSLARSDPGAVRVTGTVSILRRDGTEEVITVTSVKEDGKWLIELDQPTEILRRRLSAGRPAEYDCEGHFLPLP